MGKQMTASAGAPINFAKKWANIEFDKARREVRRLQMRIAKAANERRWGTVSPAIYALTLVLR